MPWARIDDQYGDHPKTVQVGPLGMALHIAAICYCSRHLTDGFVPDAMIPRLVNFDGITITDCNGVSNAVTNKQVTQELTQAGLFDIVPGGYMVHDYLKYNYSKAQIEAEKASNTERQKAWREKNRQNDGKFSSNSVSNNVSNAVTNASSNTAPYPSPYPLKGGGGEISEFIKIYESEIGAITAMISDELQLLSEEFTTEWFSEAVKVAAENRARSLRYVKAVLDRWKKDGFKASMVITKNARKPAPVPEPAWSEVHK